jgi:RNA polymerase sigma-70 factor (ECF subfamily)
MSATTLDDSALIETAKAGDIEAFETLVRRHGQAVYVHALRFFADGAAADDIAQEVWIKVYRQLDTFDERARFSTWLYRVTRNTCLDWVRAGKRRPVVLGEFDPVAAPGDLADEVALATSVERALQALAPEDRDAISAIGVFGLSYPEAAEALGVPVGTIKSRVFRARRTLAGLLGIEGGA